MSELQTPIDPARVGRMQSLGAVLGCDADGAPKRITLKGNYAEPSLPFSGRMQWLAKVQRLIAEHSRDGKSFPHKAGSVAYAIAHVGNVCRLGLDGIADRAGCVVNTAQACIAWLEEQGALTWNHRRAATATGAWCGLPIFTRSSLILRGLWQPSRGPCAQRGGKGRDLPIPTNATD